MLHLFNSQTLSVAKHWSIKLSDTLTVSASANINSCDLMSCLFLVSLPATLEDKLEESIRHTVVGSLFS